MSLEWTKRKSTKLSHAKSGEQIFSTRLNKDSLTNTCRERARKGELKRQTGERERVRIRVR